VRGRAAAVLASAALVAGCGGGDDQKGPAPRVKEARVSRADLGRDWPLTVSTGTLRCESSGALTFAVAGRKAYAITTAAAGRGLPPIGVLVRKDSRGRFADMTALIDRGLRLCRPGQGTLGAAQREARRRAEALRQGRPPD
jgi:uncharacterized protein DUF2511